MSIHFDSPKRRWPIWLFVACVFVALVTTYLSFNDVAQGYKHAKNSGGGAGITLDAAISSPFGSGFSSENEDGQGVPANTAGVAPEKDSEPVWIYAKYTDDLMRLREMRDKYADGDKCSGVHRAYDKQFLSLATASRDKETLELIVNYSPEASDAWKMASQKLDEIYRTLVLSADNINTLRGIIEYIPPSMTEATQFAGTRHDELLLAESQGVTSPEDLTYLFRGAVTQTARDVLAARAVSALIARGDLAHLYTHKDKKEFQYIWSDVLRQQRDNLISQMFEAESLALLRSAQTEEQVTYAYRFAPDGSNAERAATDRLNSMAGVTLAQIEAATDIDVLEKLTIYRVSSLYDAYRSRKKTFEQALIKDMSKEDLEDWIKRREYTSSAESGSSLELAKQMLNSLKIPCPG